MRLAVLTALVMLAFAGNSVLNRLAVGQNLIAPLGFALWRVVAGAAVLAGLVWLRWWFKGGQVWPQNRGRIAGVLGLLVYLIGFSMAYQGLTAGAGALTLFGVVQITMFVGAVLGREKIPMRRWLGAATAFGGLALLLAPAASGAIDPRAALAMSFAGLGWGVYSLAGRGQTDALGATAANFLLVAPALVAITLFMPHLTPASPMSPSGLALAVLSGAITSGLGYALWYQILPELGASRAAVAQLTVPLIAAAAGTAVLGESVGWRFAAASVLVLGGVVLAMRSGPAGN